MNRFSVKLHLATDEEYKRLMGLINAQMVKYAIVATYNRCDGRRTVSAFLHVASTRLGCRLRSTLGRRWNITIAEGNDMMNTFLLQWLDRDCFVFGHANADSDSSSSDSSDDEPNCGSKRNSSRNDESTQPTVPTPDTAPDVAIHTGDASLSPLVPLVQKITQPTNRLSLNPWLTTCGQSTECDGASPGRRGRTSRCDTEGGGVYTVSTNMHDFPSAIPSDSGHQPPAVDPSVKEETVSAAEECPTHSSEGAGPMRRPCAGCGSPDHYLCFLTREDVSLFRRRYLRPFKQLMAPKK